jgi:hypothetical protein
MKHLWIGLALVAGLGLLDLGCTDACQTATNRLTVRFKECNFPIAASGTGVADTTCSAADGELLQCNADCAESASCEALRGTDTQGAADYGKCNMDCK